jgi:hypothetical protein
MKSCRRFLSLALAVTTAALLNMAACSGSGTRGAAGVSGGGFGGGFAGGSGGAIAPASGTGGYGPGGSGGAGTSGQSGTEAGGGGGTGGSVPPADTGDGSIAGDSGAPPDVFDAGTEGGVAGADAGAPAGTCLQGSGDFTDKGPYAVQTKQVTIGAKGQYTIFYPNPLESNCPHPIVAWGNGTTITGGTAYAHFNEHMASWGIVAIASHNSSVGDGSFHTAAIDYLLAQNNDSSSEFFGKLSTRAGVSGHSQGGAGADAASTHPNVEANGNVQGSFGTPPGGDVAFLCLTGTADINTTGCPSAVSAATTPAMCAKYDGMDHISTIINPSAPGSIQYARLLSAWFRCFLADDTDACAMFKGGADCPVCKEPGWAEIFTNNY